MPGVTFSITEAMSVREKSVRVVRVPSARNIAARGAEARLGGTGRQLSGAL